jgi:hypothetical protein
MYDFDMYRHEMREQEELEPSWCTQLDYNGMQPHAREHLEYEVNYGRSERKFAMIEGYLTDYCPGIHFGDTP